MRKVLFTLLFSLNALANVYAQAPSWYNGDEELYNRFIETCKLARKECPNETYNCDDIKDINSFYTLNVKVGSCFLSLKQKASEQRDYTPSNAVGVASVRG